MVEIINDANFEEKVLKSEKPVLVDFYADWCGPCRMMGPLVDQLANTYSGRMKIGKINVDEDGDIAGRYGIKSIPSFLVFKNGQVVDSVTGGVPEHVLLQMIERQVA